jgi:2,5-diamino-6-(ribosylamino)-4(3H)-pyrimidinone 5'-phosphate reductase
VPWSFTSNADVSLLVLVSARTPLAYLAWLRKLEVPYLLAGDDRVDLCLALQKMGHLLGATCVVSEGGGGINGALLRSGLVDEIQMICFPTVIGGADTPSAFDGDPLTPDEAPLSMTHCGTVIRRHGSIWSRYETAAGAADVAMTAGSADTANAARQVNDSSGSAAASGTDGQAHSSRSRTGSRAVMCCSTEIGPCIA